LASAATPSQPPTVMVVTCHHVENFGAIMQACALCRAIGQLGYRAVLMNHAGVTTPLPRKQTGLRSGTFPAVMRRHWRTRRFKQRFLPLHETFYADETRLRSDPPAVDAFVCGSDQIWNLKMQGFNPAYFLTFVPDGTPRLSYAASFGAYQPTDEDRDRLTEALSKFSALSVREARGVDIIGQLIDKPVEHVLDPTLLDVDLSDCAAPPAKRKPYLFSYHVYGNPEYREALRRVAEATGLRIVSFGSTPGLKLPATDADALSAGPGQWLGFIRDAELVCTDSFHCSVFSYKFRRPFLSLAPRQSPNRVRDFLSRAGLEANYVGPDDTVEGRWQAARSTDFAAVEQSLKPHVERSTAFLERALSEALGG